MSSSDGQCELFVVFDLVSLKDYRGVLILLRTAPQAKLSGNGNCCADKERRR